MKKKGGQFKVLSNRFYYQEYRVFKNYTIQFTNLNEKLGKILRVTTGPKIYSAKLSDNN